jgi:Zn-dependent M28 family amino/carboxypeptidase
MFPAVAVLALGCGPTAAPPRAEISRGLWKAFSGAEAYRHCEALVACGPRPAGAPALETSRRYLEEQFRSAGWEVRRQAFVAETPVRPVEFVNLRARWAGVSWDRPVGVLVGSHYDTKAFERIRFVGANDGGSSTGALVEMARVLATRPELARQVELVCFDGEEAVESYTATDGLYGSRHYAREITRRQRERDRPRAVVILDMIGDPDLRVELPSDTPRALGDGLFAAARELGFGDSFGRRATPVTDDHVPFQMEGVPAIDIIDLDFAPWHTSGDTMEQVSARSLEIVGQTVMWFLERDLLVP